MPKVTRLVGDKPAHGLMTTGPVPPLLSLSPGVRVTVHPAWCCWLAASARPPWVCKPFPVTLASVGWCVHPRLQAPFIL